MSDRLTMHMARLDAQRRLVAENLKRCPLCNAVNAASNAECFVCRWQGRFEHDPSLVQEALGDLITRCPELVDAMLDYPAPEPTRWQRAVQWLRARFRRPIDLRV